MTQLFRILFFTSSLLFSSQLRAQKTVSQPESFSFFSVGFGSYLAAGDYDEYFGTHFQLGGQLGYKTKNNLMFTLEGNFIFGNQVESDEMLKNVRTSNDEILDKDGQIATILFFHRGYSFLATAQKILPTKWAKNPNSGIFISGGLGFLQHKVRVENQNNRIPFLDGDYEKGYDRRTNGLVLKQSIGYVNFSNSGLANFSLAFEVYEAFTKNRRAYNFDLGGPDNRSRLDLAFGIRFSWLVPMFSRMSTQYYID